MTGKLKKGFEKKIVKKGEKQKLIEKGKALITKLGKILDRHAERNKNTNHINKKIFYLFRDPFIFINAYNKISKNKGSLTEGYNNDKTISYFGLTKAINLAKKISNGTYKFSPVKRTWIPKPGKKSKRPIDVATQSDRTVQEAIRGILEAMYEPIFLGHAEKTKELSNNYGFRPGHSTWSAINKLEINTRKCNIIIEGDIVSAYNNVDHDLLLKILKEKITDKKFLRLIKNMLESGVMDTNKYEHSLNGTPQGEIVSPLLFNIYMLGFDQYIYKEFIVPIQKKNKTKSENIKSPQYNKTSHLANKALKRLQEYKKKTGVKPEPAELKKLTKEFKKARALRLKTTYPAIPNHTKGILYVRYADNWVLAFTGTRSKAQEMKKNISNFLKTQRNMGLDSEKTKITYASEGYSFLGFRIRLDTRESKLMRVLQKDKNGRYSRPLKRTTSRIVTVEPDKDRIMKMLKNLKVCRKKDAFPIGRAIWRIYDEFQIVLKYNKTFRGIYNYYEPCGRLSKLSEIAYILQYSCAKTIAFRKKISMSKVFRLYGKNLKIKATIKGVKSDKQRIVEFLTLAELRKISKNRKTKINALSEPRDPFIIQEHWRTKFKIYDECCICGATECISLYHTNSLRGIDNKTGGPSAIKSQTNRLQIPICHDCHLQITHGRYNDPKKPVEFYNEFLAKL